MIFGCKGRKERRGEFCLGCNVIEIRNSKKIWKIKLTSQKVELKLWMDGWKDGRMDGWLERRKRRREGGREDGKEVGKIGKIRKLKN